ncbi:MAG: EAL domain-containing protein [Rhodocyclaceae bacterium]|nr:MAG: EAL domain-containing protein [Rhodocyclaceae bacterium]
MNWLDRITQRQMGARGFFALLALFVLSSATATGYFIHRLRVETLSYHLRIAEMQVRTFEDHLTQSVLVTDQMMVNLADTENLERPAPDLRAILRRSIANLPQVRSLSVLREDGQVLASSSAGNEGQRLGFTDPQPALDGDEGLLQVAGRWLGRDFSSGQAVSQASAEAVQEARDLGFIPLLRKIKSGGHRYTLVAALNPDYFVQKYRERLLQSPGDLHVLRYDGLPLFGTSAAMQWGALRAEDWDPLALSEREMGSFDDAEHNELTAYRTSRLYPLVLVLRLKRGDALTEWRKDALRFSAMAALIILSISAFAILFFFHQRRLGEQRAAAVLAEKERLGAVLDALPAMVFMIGPDSRYRFINRAAREFFSGEGLPQLNNGEYGTDAASRYLRQCNPTLFDRHADEMRQLMAGKVDQVFSEHTMQLREGLRWHQLMARRIEAEGAEGVVAMVSDITGRKDAETQLHLAASVFKASAEGILVTDEAVNVLSVNAAFTQITGYTSEDMIGQNPKKLASGQHHAAFYKDMWLALKEKGLWQGEIVNRRKNGRIYPEWLTISAVRDDLGKVCNYVGVFSDITERKASEERIRHLSEHDFLTGLPNRILFQDRVSHVIAHSERNGARFALLFIDLDRFKTVNDTLGHHIGDLLLKEVANRIGTCVRSTDTVSRQGGDEFLVLLENIEQPEDAGRVAEKLLERLADTCVLEGHELHITPSIGIALYPEDGRDMTTLIKHADVAMYHSKEHGRNTFHYFTSAMNATANERLLMEHGLRRALENGELEMHYQPLVALVGQKVVGAEALMRWRHPDLGMVPPLKFIPVAEECGLIVSLGEWALREACKQGAAWHAAGWTDLTMAVNVSAPQFAQEDFLDAVRAILADTGYPPERLEFEVTESLLIVSSEVLRANIEGLRGLGIRLAIDDFGTGYSSLAYLRKLPIDKLKIDRSFVRDVTLDADDATITTTIVQMAHSIGLQVLAEGVETQGQLNFLQSHGCNEVQGFYFSPALPAVTFTAYLERNNGIAAQSAEATEST